MPALNLKFLVTFGNYLMSCSDVHKRAVADTECHKCPKLTNIGVCALCEYNIGMYPPCIEQYKQRIEEDERIKINKKIHDNMTNINLHPFLIHKHNFPRHRTLIEI